VHFTWHHHKSTWKTRHQILQANVATTQTDVLDQTSYNTDDGHDMASRHVHLDKGKGKLRETLDDEDSWAAQLRADALLAH